MISFDVVFVLLVVFLIDVYVDFFYESFKYVILYVQVIDFIEYGFDICFV